MKSKTVLKENCIVNSQYRRRKQGQGSSVKYCAFIINIYPIKKCFALY